LWLLAGAAAASFDAVPLFVAGAPKFTDQMLLSVYYKLAEPSFVRRGAASQPLNDSVTSTLTSVECIFGCCCCYCFNSGCR